MDGTGMHPLFPETPASETPRLLADAMLGKLARWLRLLGYDTLYMHAADAVIAHRARAEGRILLTRDHELTRRRGLQAIFIEAQSLDAQLEQVVREVGLPPEDVAARCMVCNGLLQEISRAEARSRVPPYVFETQEVFHRCARCGRITWMATHWPAIQARLDRILAAVASHQS
ncbi:MAG: Mut7-C RNAse domain-containing protein [Anaerolineae bacterium]|nr:Mut7-C RNAse domain-containing protein [Anaerolineae bacterium]